MDLSQVSLVGFRRADPSEASNIGFQNPQSPIERLIDETAKSDMDRVKRIRAATILKVEPKEITETARAYERLNENIVNKIRKSQVEEILRKKKFLKPKESLRVTKIDKEEIYRASEEVLIRQYAKRSTKQKKKLKALQNQEETLKKIREIVFQQPHEEGCLCIECRNCFPKCPDGLCATHATIKAAIQRFPVTSKKFLKLKIYTICYWQKKKQTDRKFYKE